MNCSRPREFVPGLDPGAWIWRLRNNRPNVVAMLTIALFGLNHREEGGPVALGQKICELAQIYRHIDRWGGCSGCW